MLHSWRRLFRSSGIMLCLRGWTCRKRPSSICSQRVS